MLIQAFACDVTQPLTLYQMKFTEEGCPDVSWCIGLTTEQQFSISHGYPEMMKLLLVLL